MIQAVIFDFGGVVTSSPFEALERMERERGLPPGFVRAVNAANPDGNAWALFERAEIDAATFDARFAAEARALGHALRGADVLALLAGDIRPRMVAAIDRLQADGYRLGCITNNVPTGKGTGMAGTAEKARAVAAVLARFEYVIESSKIGIRKPDPRIYAMMCEALDVVPAACVSRRSGHQLQTGRRDGDARDQGGGRGAGAGGSGRRARHAALLNIAASMFPRRLLSDATRNDQIHRDTTTKGMG